jgi:gas vesicle protein
MDSNALFSLIGTIIGSLAGILVANKLTNFRLEQLEKKLDKYADNQENFRERLVKVEESSKSAHHRIDDIVDQLDIHERRG